LKFDDIMNDPLRALLAGLSAFIFLTVFHHVSDLLSKKKKPNAPRRLNDRPPADWPIKGSPIFGNEVAVAIQGKKLVGGKDETAQS
jgi:hypothetical protein